MLKNLYREFQQIFYGFGVPFVSTTPIQIKILLEHLDLDNNSVFYDIGCWDGRVISQIAKNFPNTRCVWYESSPYPFSLAKKHQGIKNLELFRDSIFKVWLGHATHIYLYMVPYMTRIIFKKIQSECKAWTKVYIKSHTIPGILISKTIPLSQKNNLYIYTI